MDTMKMGSARTCSGCKKPLAANAPSSLCPECLIKAGLGTGVDTGPDDRADGGRTPFAAPTPEEVGHLFPQLEILGFIGQGGMGAVYKARQKELDRVAALKILPPGIGENPAFAERFTREAKALAKLNHPGIVTLYEFGKADGLFFFLMEFVDGMSLRRLLEVERISAREALAIVPQICDALQYAHDQGIVHRDIKPENILLDRQGRVKVADFGLAKLVETGSEPIAPGNSTTASVSLTEVGKVMGTPQYMAPEQREHPTEVDHRADIYSLGVVFYQMLTGELPGQRIEPPSHKVQIDVRLDEVVLRALEKQPRRRYQQVSQVKGDVETIARSGAGEGSAIPGAGAGAAVWANRKAWGLLVASACFLVGALIAGERVFLSQRAGGNVVILWLSLVAMAGFAVAAYRHNRAVRFAAAAMVALAGLGVMGVVVATLAGVLPRPGSPGDPAWASAAKLPEGSSLSEVMERVITVGNRRDSFYRLDLGAYVPATDAFDPSSAKEPADLWKWLTEHNVDLLAQRENGRPVLKMSDMVSATLNEEDFNRLTPQTLAKNTAWLAALNRPYRDRRPALTGLMGNPMGKSTVVFQTRFDVVGLLQVVGTVSDPPGVRIWYKLITVPGQPGRRADTPHSVPVLASKPGEYAVALSNGATVEVVAVARNPRRANLWWRPDGVVLAEPPADELRFSVTWQGSENPENEFVLLTRTVTPSGDKSFHTQPVYLPPPARPPSLGVALFKDKAYVADAPLLWFAQPPETLTYRFGLGAGPWLPVAVFEGDTTKRQPGEETVEFTRPQAEGANTDLTFRHSVDRKRFSLRLVAERSDGAPAEVALWDHYSTNGLNAARAVVHDTAPAQIKRYHVLKTPWLWGEISRIAMKPGTNALPALPPVVTVNRGREPEGFGPIMERVVNADGATENILIDFDSGRLLFPPPDLNRKDRAALEAWLRKEGVDALADASETVRGFVGFDMITRPVTARQWDNVTGAAVADNQFLTLGRPGSPVYLSAKGQLPETFLIKTREGGMGILQITSFTENPRGIKVRYKLVRGTVKGVSQTGQRID